MSKIDKFLCSIYGGVIVSMVAMRLGIPLWSTWSLGDASDYGVFSGMIIWLLLKAIRKP